MPYVSPDDKDSDGTRVCRTCDERKPLVAFPLVNTGKHRRRRCKVCVENRRKELRLADPERYREMDKFRAIRLKYDLTPEAYVSLVDSQGGACAICSTSLSATARTPHVDHDHATGDVRGVLCFLCNTALGKFRDDPDLLRAAIAYLERNAA
jgi:hypothetical protein